MLGLLTCSLTSSLFKLTQCKQAKREDKAFFWFAACFAKVPLVVSLHCVALHTLIKGRLVRIANFNLDFISRLLISFLLFPFPRSNLNCNVNNSLDIRSIVAAQAVTSNKLTPNERNSSPTRIYLSPGRLVQLYKYVSVAGNGL